VGPGSHMILILLWARKETTKYMVRVHAHGTEQCFGSDTVSTWLFRMEEPCAFHTVCFTLRLTDYCVKDMRR